MGTVWRVWDSREERIVAAKVLRQSDAVSLLRFVREQSMRIDHTHVVTPMSWAGVDDRVLFDPEEQGEVELNGERYVILRERDVHAVAAERIEESTGLYL